MRITAALLILCLFAGCAIWPSTWRFGKTPLERAEAKEKSADGANRDLLEKAQRDVHQAEEIFRHAPESRPVTLGLSLLSDARASIDQAIGAPTAADEAGWREFAIRLLSEKLEVRVQAEMALAAQRRETAAVSTRADRAVAEAGKARRAALEYAAEREDLADFAGKLKLGFFAIIGLLCLGTVLSLVARFVPALGLAAKVVNGVVAPGLTFVAHRAEDGLRRIGAGIASLRKTSDQAEQLIERHFDGVTDADHQRLIASGAAAAGNPPPTS